MEHVASVGIEDEAFALRGDGLRSITPVEAEGFKYTDELVAPHETDGRGHVEVGILPLLSHRLDLDAAVSCPRLRDAPPARHKLACPAKVARTDHESHAVEAPVVDLELAGQTVERVLIALDLVAREKTVHHRHIDACLAEEHHLVDDLRAVLPAVVLVELRAEDGADFGVTIAHGRAPAAPSAT